MIYLIYIIFILKENLRNLYLINLRKKIKMNRLNYIYTHLSKMGEEYSRIGEKYQGSMKGMTVVVSGGSRGIGLAIVRRLAQEGCNVAIMAKTDKPHPKLEGTIYTAADECIKAGGQAMGLKCDIRYEEQIQACIQKIVDRFGGIDILINNASAINLSNTAALPTKT